MRRFLSRRVQGLAQSDIRRMSRECETVGGINLAMGSCDLPTPPFVRDAAIAALQAQKSSYTFPEGAAPLREAIAAKLERDNGIRADPASEIIVTVGSAGAFAATLEALLDPGDGVLLLEPYYGYHLNVLLTVGLEPHYLTLDPPDFTVREEELRRAVRPNTRAIVICTPSNPSGKMYGPEELSAVARVAHDHDLLVVTDEIYEYIRYDGRPHISPASVDGLWERTVSIMGLSKTFSVTGWRLGYAVAREELAQPIRLVNDLHYVCAPTPLQHGVIPGVQAPRSYFDSLQVLYQGKRDLICDALTRAGLNPIIPQGAFYVLADIRQHGYESSHEAAMDLLRQTRVAAAPGTDFHRGAAGHGVMRFCFAKDDSVLEEACRRIREFRPAVATV
ncbi:MAG TPA: pyridoxal phosphate-dependent aminotransferase [Thermoanaerobaculia bacterium]|nr:pyridoxal phosphate-dependent aminotransferase [Thermoanaerobaculia bacterium]